MLPSAASFFKNQSPCTAPADLLIATGEFVAAGVEFPTEITSKNSGAGGRGQLPWECWLVCILNFALVASNVPAALFITLSLSDFPDTHSILSSARHLVSAHMGNRYKLWHL